MQRREGALVSPKRVGVPLVLSAPSGAGKTTLYKRLLARDGQIAGSISHTTRAPRGTEEDGVDYHFVDDATFQSMVDAGDFLEWARVHGNCYGTTRRDVETRLSQGHDIVFDIDIQGGFQIAEQLSQAVTVFILPPSMAVLETRLRKRASDSEDVIRKRLTAAQSEIEGAMNYDYWVVNDDLDTAEADLWTILQAARMRMLDRDAVIADVVGKSERPKS